MKKKILLRIAAGIAVFLLVPAIFFIADSILGNPLTAKIAKGKALEYINDKYGHLNLEIKTAVYNPKDGSYLISVNSGASMDTHFFISYRDGEIFRDDYEVSVLSGMNTMDRFCTQYKKSLTPLVQAKINDVTNISVMPEKLTKYDIALDSVFDQRLVENVDIVISCTGGTDAKHFSDILKKVYNVMKENGYAAAKFGVTGQHEKVLTELRNIKPAHIESENLENILQQAIANAEYDGITAFSKGH